jgi:small RNA 2'-O-methyltransferase
MSYSCLSGCGDAASEYVSASPHEERLDTVLRALLQSGAESVLDLGCGEGELLIHLARERQFQRIVGIDISVDALLAAEKLRGTALPPGDERVLLLEASFAKPDRRLEGYDAAALVETIEHIDPRRLTDVEHAVFGSYCPRTVLVTTPNSEYNVIHGMSERALRHPDHRFEWTRAKFRSWCFGVARRKGYDLRFSDIGESHPLLGSTTQMATFMRLECAVVKPRMVGAGLA